MLYRHMCTYIWHVLMSKFSIPDMPGIVHEKIYVNSLKLSHRMEGSSYYFHQASVRVPMGRHYKDIYKSHIVPCVAYSSHLITSRYATEQWIGYFHSVVRGCYCYPGNTRSCRLGKFGHSMGMCTYRIINHCQRLAWITNRSFVGEYIMLHLWWPSGHTIYCVICYSG